MLPSTRSQKHVHKAGVEVFRGSMWLCMEQEHRTVLCQMWKRFRMYPDSRRQRQGTVLMLTMMTTSCEDPQWDMPMVHSRFNSMGEADGHYRVQAVKCTLHPRGGVDNQVQSSDVGISTQQHHVRSCYLPRRRASDLQWVNDKGNHRLRGNIVSVSHAWSII